MANNISSWTIFELINPEESIKHLAATHSSLIDTIMANGNVLTFDGSTYPTVGFGLLDKTAVIIAYDNNQHMHAILETPGQETAIDSWVKDQYGNYRQVATAID